MNIQSQIVAKMKAAKQIVITAHISPDGDSVGSSLALFHFCQSLGLQVRICHPDPAPGYLAWLTGFDQILNLEENEAAVKEQLAQADLIFSLDYNHQSRVGEKMQLLLEASQAFKIMVDHHLFPDSFAGITYSDTSSCSTCQLIYQLISESGNLDQLNTTIGTAIYLGIMTDTGSFRFNSVKPLTHEIIANLLRIGVKNDYIHEQVYDINSLEKLKLRSYACAEKLVVLPAYKTAYITLTKEELKRYSYQKGDTEGLVNVALSIDGIKIAAFFSEDEEKIKISFRSKGKENPVNEFAGKYFGGGGHANAAGGKFVGTIEEAVSLFLQVLKEVHKDEKL